MSPKRYIILLIILSYIYEASYCYFLGRTSKGLRCSRSLGHVSIAQIYLLFLGIIVTHGYIIKIYKWLILFYTRGNFATVKLAIHKKSGEKFAIKIIDKKKFLLSNATKRKNALMDEVFILKQVDHKNVSPRKKPDPIRFLPTAWMEY